MAYPNVEATGAWAVGTTSPAAPTLPSHAAGDLLLVEVHSTTDDTTVPTHSTPSGWTLISSGANDSAGTRRGRVSLYGKKAASGSETFSSTVTPTGSQAVQHRARGHTVAAGTWNDTGTLSDAWEDPTTAAASDSSTLAFSGFATAGAERLALACIAQADDTATGVTDDNSYGTTLGTASDSATGTDGYSTARTKQVSSAGSQDVTFTFTAGGSVSTCGVLVALLPSSTSNGAATDTAAVVDSARGFVGAYVVSSTSQVNASAASISDTTPANQAGDIIIVVGGGNDTAGVGVLSISDSQSNSYTQVQGDSQNNRVRHVWWRRSTGTATPTVQLDFTETNRVSIGIIVVRNAKETGSPVDVAGTPANGSAQSTVTAAGVTTAEVYELLLMLGMSGGGTYRANAFGSPLTNVLYNEDARYATWGYQASAGASGDKTHTWDDAGSHTGRPGLLAILGPAGTPTGAAVDTAGVSDQAAGVASLVGAGTDSAAVADQASGAYQYQAGAVDTAAVADQAAGVFAYNGAAVDSAAVADQAAGLYSFLGAATDAPHVTDSAAGTLSYLGAGTDAAAVTDQAAGVASMVGAAADAAAVSDQAAGSPVYSGAAVDSASVADSATGAAADQYNGAATDAASVADQAAGVASFAAAAVDTAGVADSSSGARQDYGASTDAASVADSAVGVVLTLGQAVDTAAVSDSAGATLTLRGASVDSASVTDQAAGAWQAQGQATDTASVADSAAGAPSFAGAGADAASVVDSAAGAYLYRGAASDSASVSDSAHGFGEGLGIVYPVLARLLGARLAGRLLPSRAAAAILLGSRGHPPTLKPK